MKSIFLFFVLTIICLAGFCQNRRSDDMEQIPDSIKAIGFYIEVSVTEKNISKRKLPGIVANNAAVKLGYNKKQKIIEFNFYHRQKVIAFGQDVYKYRLGNAWNFEWKENETYPLLILIANDSASHSTIYSGYIFLTQEKKWKLISTNLFTDTNRVKHIWPGNIKSDKKSKASYTNRWLLRSGGSWKALDSQTTKPPALRPFSNIDSLAQQKIEEENLIAKLKDSITFKEGIFYQSIKEGTGKQVNVSDTVVIHYKGWLFSNGSVFDETKEKPASFPLQRLIRGWQVGLPQCKVGGKIRLYIPSGSAYGIRTFATDIPPNSTLVFDIEVLDAKEKVLK